MRPLTPLCELAIKYSTDKGGRHNTYGYQPCEGTHEYTPIYWDMLDIAREHVKAVLEIGINAGGSLRMWEEYFPNATIIGVDIEAGYLINQGRIKSFQADASDADQLRAVIKASGIDKFDLIIDDGSHNLGDQAVAVATLPQYLSDSGVMVVEDLPDHQGTKDALGAQVHRGYCYGFVQPEPGTLNRSAPELLMIITSDAEVLP